MRAEDSAAGQDEGEGAGAEATIRRPGREPKHSTSPAATLEASFEALNVKKFDLTFAMDPLFRRTSAQFDEGGAKGRPCLKRVTLLMMRLASYGQPAERSLLGMMYCWWAGVDPDHWLAVLAGLLLNNLSVIRGLELMFDSLDIPDQATEASQGTEERRLVCPQILTTFQPKLLIQIAALTRLQMPGIDARCAPKFQCRAGGHWGPAAAGAGSLTGR